MKKKTPWLLTAGLVLFLVGVYYSLTRENSVFHAVNPLVTPITGSGEATSSGQISNTATNTNTSVNANTSVQTNPSVPLSPEDQRKMNILKEIFATKQDNDPRMDTELSNLSPSMKKGLQEFYHTIPAEKLNQRGTIAFLLGRKLETVDDVDFLKSVLMEKLCLSLADCSKPAAPSSGEESHLDGINETTAAYPQLMAIRSLSTQYQELSSNESANKAMMDHIVDALHEALHSQNARSALEAEKVLRAIKR